MKPWGANYSHPGRTQAVLTMALVLVFWGASTISASTRGPEVRILEQTSLTTDRPGIRYVSKGRPGVTRAVASGSAPIRLVAGDRVNVDETGLGILSVGNQVRIRLFRDTSVGISSTVESSQSSPISRMQVSLLHGSIQVTAEPVHRAMGESAFAGIVTTNAQITSDDAQFFVRYDDSDGLPKTVVIATRGLMTLTQRSGDARGFVVISATDHIVQAGVIGREIPRTLARNLSTQHYTDGSLALSGEVPFSLTDVRTTLGNLSGVYCAP